MKIVSLLPRATELPGGLGLEDSLAVISHECDTPQSVLHLPHAVGIMCCGFGLEDNAGYAETVRSSDAALGGFDGPILTFDANRFFSRPTLTVVDGARRLHEHFGAEHAVGDGLRRVN